MFIFSRIVEGITDYIPSLDQGLAVLTNSTRLAVVGWPHACGGLLLADYVIYVMSRVNRRHYNTRKRVKIG